MTGDADWWAHGVIYQIYPRSFADGSGDGVGDLAGVVRRLPEIAELGVDAVWLSPFYTSPQRDAGYDVADYTDVDPIFGTLGDADRLIEVAHGAGLRVIVDLVPNHSSSDHVWFQEALAAPRHSPERARYIFRDGRGPTGDEPPNNWESVFGGPAWTRVTEPDGSPGQWYLHLFDTSQPDFDWSNPWVRERFEDVLRFWLDRGVDGFRVDVAHGLVKEDGLPDFVPPEDAGSMGSGIAGEHQGADSPPPTPYWAQPGVHEVYREWRRLVDSYDGVRVLCAEAWVEPPEKLALWVRDDEMHQAFNFSYLEAGWSAEAVRGVIDRSLSAFGAVGAPSTWVLSNHDVVRHSSRLALTAEIPQGTGIGPFSPGLPDPVVGLERARAASALMLALPGAAYLYQGEELGLPEVVYLPAEARQDPTWHRTGGERYGRDGCRVPLPWEADEPAYGFSPSGASWLPQPPGWGRFARDAQRGVEGSTLELYRALLALRAERRLGAGVLEWAEVEDPEVLAFRNGGVLVLSNLGSRGFAIPPSLRGPVLAKTAPLVGYELVPDSTVWLAAD